MASPDQGCLNIHPVHEHAGQQPPEVVPLAGAAELDPHNLAIHQLPQGLGRGRTARFWRVRSVDTRQSYWRVLAVVVSDEERIAVDDADDFELAGRDLRGRVSTWATAGEEG